MSLDISEQDRNLLLELIENAEQTAIESVAHTETRRFRSVLKERLDLLASVREKIRSCDTLAA